MKSPGRAASRLKMQQRRQKVEYVKVLHLLDRDCVLVGQSQVYRAWQQLFPTSLRKRKFHGAVTRDWLVILELDGSTTRFTSSTTGFHMAKHFYTNFKACWSCTPDSLNAKDSTKLTVVPTGQSTGVHGPVRARTTGEDQWHKSVWKLNYCQICKTDESNSDGNSNGYANRNYNPWPLDPAVRNSVVFIDLELT